MQDLDMNTQKAMSEAIAVLDTPGSQGVGRTMYLKTRWTKVEEPSRSGRLLSLAGGQDTWKRVYPALWTSSQLWGQVRTAVL